MALRPAYSDEFDDLLMEAFEAERAGVFGRTPVDVQGMMSGPVSRPGLRLHRLVLAGLPVAASVALFIGLATFWKAGSRPGGTILDDNASVNGAAGSIERCQTLENLRACFTGPGMRARTDCNCVDLDSDGDVDLRDLGMFQLEDPGH